MKQTKDFKNIIKRRQEALSWLREHFPETFSKKNLKPMKIGIYEDIFATKIEGIPAKKWTRLALRHYVNSHSYLNALQENTSRIDLNGNEAGVVTKEQSLLAENKLKQSKTKKSISKKKEDNAQINSSIEVSGETKRTVLTLKKTS